MQMRITELMLPERLDWFEQTIGSSRRSPDSRSAIRCTISNTRCAGRTNDLFGAGECRRDQGYRWTIRSEPRDFAGIRVCGRDAARRAARRSVRGPPHAAAARDITADAQLLVVGGAQRVAVSRVKCEAAGAAGAYLDRQVNVGDVLEASAPRGTFTLEPDARPLVLASAGIGITPVLAILHVLAAERSMREIWWLYGARNREHHPFALASRRLDL
jgi:hypothetical protein